MLRYPIIVTILLMSMSGCDRSHTVGTWLRVRTRSETTIIPHLLSVGGGSTRVEVLQDGTWTTAYEERGTLRMWSLGAAKAALLHFAQTEQGGYYALVHSHSPADTKRFPAADAQMLPSVDRAAVVRIEWSTVAGVPAEITVRSLDLQGAETRASVVLALPAPPGHTPGQTCFYSQFVGYRAGVPVLEDALCGSGRLALATPPRVLAAGEAVDAVEGEPL